MTGNLFSRAARASLLDLNTLPGGTQYYSDQFIIGIGQSNAVGLFDTQGAQWVAWMDHYWPGRTNRVYSGATGGAALLYGNSNPVSPKADGNFFLDPADGTTGAAWATFETAAREAVATGSVPLALVVSQGESDFSSFESQADVDAYWSAFDEVFLRRARAVMNAPFLPIFIERAGRFDYDRNVAWPALSWQRWRNSQKEFVARRPRDVFLLPEGLDVAMDSDGTSAGSYHATNATYARRVERYLARIVRVVGSNRPNIGPRVIQARRNATNVFLTVQHEEGSALAPASGMKGFRYFDGVAGTGEVAVSTAVAGPSAHGITLGLGGTPVAATQTVVLGFDSVEELRGGSADTTPGVADPTAWEDWPTDNALHLTDVLGAPMETFELVVPAIAVSTTGMDRLCPLPMVADYAAQLAASFDSGVNADLWRNMVVTPASGTQSAHDMTLGSGANNPTLPVTEDDPSAFFELGAGAGQMFARAGTVDPFWLGLRDLRAGDDWWCAARFRYQQGSGTDVIFQTDRVSSDLHLWFCIAAATNSLRVTYRGAGWSAAGAHNAYAELVDGEDVFVALGVDKTRQVFRFWVNDWRFDSEWPFELEAGVMTGSPAGGNIPALFGIANGSSGLNPGDRAYGFCIGTGSPTNQEMRIIRDLMIARES